MAAALVSAAQLPVFPPEAQKLEPLPLPVLIERLLPDAGERQLAWTHGLDSPIAWITRGYDVSGALHQRVGLARVTVDGDVATLLEREINEIAWTVTLQTAEPPRFGPTEINIIPGPPGSACFGDLFTGCHFDIDQSISAIDGELTIVCERGRNTGNGSAVFFIRTRSKAGYIRYYENTGSAGNNAGIDISTRQLDCN